MAQIRTYLRTRPWPIGLACALWLALGFAPSPKQEAYATLIIYQKGYMRSSFGLDINEQKVIKRMRPRTWMKVQVPAGALTLTTVPEFRYPTTDGKSFSLEVEEGKVYFLEAIIDYEFFATHMYLALREAARAQKDMRRFKEEENAIKKIE